MLGCNQACRNAAGPKHGWSFDRPLALLPDFALASRLLVNPAKVPLALLAPGSGPHSSLCNSMRIG
eukprot:9741254-Lingulodinium_polyedra.AAC.1